MSSRGVNRLVRCRAEIALLLVITISFLSTYLVFPQKHAVIRSISEALDNQLPIGTSPKSTALGAKPKRVALPLSSQPQSRNVSHPLFFGPHTKRDDDPFYYIAARCYGEKLFARIQDAQNGILSNARRFRKADIANGWSARDDVTGIGLGEDWDGAFANIANGASSDGKGARLVQLTQDVNFINNQGEQISTLLIREPALIQKDIIRDYSPTPVEDQEADALYRSIYFARPIAGIFSISIRSPRSVLKNLYPLFKEAEIQRWVPPLSRFSDAVWTVWTLGMGRKEPGRLRYIGHEDISNFESEEVMDYVFQRKRPGVAETWPGEEFGLDQEEGLALLATPNGLGTAWLLIDRAATLGRRVTGVRVRIWKNEENFWYMLWDLGEHPDEGSAPLDVIGGGTILPLNDGVMPGRR
ncbi:MAG: hypothetical protein LQ352_007318 [Teloschistes flavicans]|nr:MAG: hypothetical protein LQ352_007318 [Teloschistes flavicans]